MFGVVGLAALLSACAAPDKNVYLNKGEQTGTPTLVGLSNQGLPCSHYRSGDVATVFCGKWSTPAGQVKESKGDTGPLPAQLDSYVHTLQNTPECDAPAPVARPIPGATSAVQATCSLGGRQRIALAAENATGRWYAEGRADSLELLRNTISLLAGVPRDQIAGLRDIKPGQVRVGRRRPSSTDPLEWVTVANIVNREGNWAESAELFDGAIDLLTKRESKPGQKDADRPVRFAATIGLAIQLSNQKKFTEAEVQFRKANDVNLLLSTPLASAAYAQYRGLAYLNQGVYRFSDDDMKKAINYLKSALSLYQRNLPDGRQTAAQAATLRFNPMPLAAAIANDGATRTADQTAVDAILGVIEVKRDLAAAYRSFHQFDEAVKVGQEAEDFARDNGMTMPKVAAYFYRTSAIALLDNQQYGPSAKKFDAAVSAFDQGWPDYKIKPQAETQLRRADALLQSGRHTASQSDCDDAAGLLRVLDDGVSPDILSFCLASLAKEATTSAMPQAVLAKMFEFSQLVVTSSTADLTQKAAERLNADPETARLLSEKNGAEEKLNNIKKRQRLAASASASDRAAIDAEAAEATAGLLKADADLQEKAPNSAQLARTVSAETMFKALRDKEAFVSIVLAADEGWTFLLRDKTIHLAQIPGGEREIRKLVASVRQSVEPIDDVTLPAFDVDSARRLYKLTLGGVATWLKPDDELTIAPSGSLLSIPFGVLVDDKSTGPAGPDTPYLLTTHAVTHVPSPVTMLALRRASQRPEASNARRWFGFGAPPALTPAQRLDLYSVDRCGNTLSADRFGQLHVLTNDRKELDNARRIYNAPGADELTGARFTRNAVLSRSYNDYSVLHFATHALSASDIACQREPAIVTAFDPADSGHGLLSASDIIDNVDKLRFNADVVILSACNTGGGEAALTDSSAQGGQDATTVAGEGLSGLARSFFFAGARGLMVTHWNANDRTSAQVVGDALLVIRSLPDAKLTTALRKAQLNVLRTSGYEHPFFWGPFAVIGEGGGRDRTTVTASVAAKPGP